MDVDDKLAAYTIEVLQQHAIDNTDVLIAQYYKEAFHRAEPLMIDIDNSELERLTS